MENKIDFDKFWESIPLDRNDEECPNNCCQPLVGIRVLNRKINDHYVQSAWNCDKCGSLVIMVDELHDQDCPLCGCGGQFTISQVNKYKIINSNDLKIILEEGIDDYWQSENFPLINKLRELVGLEVYSPELMERIREYWRNL